jgi:hypothetical protein
MKVLSQFQLLEINIINVKIGVQQLHVKVPCSFKNIVINTKLQSSKFLKF